MGFLAREFPHMVDGYNRLYAGAYAKPDYVTSVRQMVAMLQDRYKLHPRTRSAPGTTETPDAPREAEQPGLEWD